MNTCLEKPRNRRTAVRFACDLSATCWAADAAGAVKGRVQTLSAGGLSLGLERLPEAVPFLTVELTSASRGVARRVQARVLYALLRDEGCIVGVSFPEKLAAADLAEILA